MADILEAAPLGMLLVAPNGRILHHNSAIISILGYQAGKLPAQIHDLVHPDSHTLERDLRESTGERSGNGLAAQLKLLHSSGTAIPARVNMTTLSTAREQTAELLYIIEDISALQQTENRYRDLIESLNDWVWEIDPQGRYTYCGPQVRDILGYEPTEMIGTTPFDSMPPDERQRIAAIVEPLFTKQQSFSGLENRNLHRDGYPVYLETSGVPIFDAQGRFVGYRGVDRDVSERRDILAELKELNTELEMRVHQRTAQIDAIYQLSRDGIAIVDPETNFQECNPAYCQLTGYSHDELLNKSCIELTHPDDRDASVRAMQRVLQDGHIDNLEKRCIHRDGRTILVQMSISRLDDNRFLINARDISALRQYQNSLKASEARFRGIIEASPAAMLLVDPHGQILETNPRFREIFGTDVSRIAHMDDFWQQASTGSAHCQILRRRWDSFLEQQHTNGHATDTQRPFCARLNGQHQRPYDMELHISYIDENILILMQDLSEQRAAERDLQKYIEIVDENVIISQTDLDGIITYASKAFCEVSGFSSDELVGQNHNIVRHPDMPDELFAELWETIRAGFVWHGEIKNCTKQHSHYWVDTYIYPVLNEHGKQAGYMAVRQDITDRKRVEELSIRDRLTGAYNRLRLDEVLAEEMRRAERYRHSFCLIMLDIDHFKKINDTYGHLAGDEVLKSLSALARQTIRATDIFGRWGGEEFMIICPETSLDGALVLAENMRRSVAEYDFPAVGQNISCSLGTACLDPHEPRSIEALVDAADQALYRAKQLGRNRVESEPSES